MYSTAFHDGDLSNTSFLVTGGAGFIGSNIVEYLVRHGAGTIRILDNLSEGKKSNIEPYLGIANVEFMEADITDEATCQEACRGMDVVCHQAALGSVPRSIATPLVTNHANVTGFLNMLVAAKDEGVKRFVYASSSSVYGDSPQLPKIESVTGAPLSPYAVSKCINELYADVFALNYGMQLIGLRYFNVFGPRQKPDGPYAAVIPLFIDALLKNEPPMINGDGEQSRDFTFVTSAVQANIKAMLVADADATGQVYNVAHGKQTTINELFASLRDLVGTDLEPQHREPRPGDVQHSLADISASEKNLRYQPETKFSEGLRQTLNWFRQKDDVL